MTDTITMVYFNETLHTPNAVASSPYRTLSTDANGVPTFGTFTQSNIATGASYPDSQTDGWAIGANFAGFHEVDFWSTVNADGMEDQGFYYYQKLGASSAQKLGTLIGDSTVSEWDLFSGGNTCAFGITATEYFLAATSGVPFNFYVDGHLSFSLPTTRLGWTNTSAGGGTYTFAIPNSASSHGYTFPARDGTVILSPDTPVVGDTLIYDGTDWRATIGASYSYNTPLTGATVTMGAAERRCVINPAGALAALTVVLPPSPGDGQIAGICSSQVITALTTNAGTGGAAVVGAPAALTAGQAFTMLYRSTGNSWYISA